MEDKYNADFLYAFVNAKEILESRESKLKRLTESAKRILEFEKTKSLRLQESVTYKTAI